MLAEWAAIAIDNARLYRDVRERRDELERAVSALETTSSIARAVGGETDLERILELLVKRGRALVDARGVMIIELRTGGELVVRAARGRGARRPRGRADPARGVARRRGPAHPARRAADRRPAQLRFASASASARRPGCSCRSSSAARPSACWAAFDRTVGGPEFTAEDERLIQAFAAAAATAVATAQHVPRSGSAQRGGLRAGAPPLGARAARRHAAGARRRCGCCCPARAGPGRRRGSRAAVDDAVDRDAAAIDGLRAPHHRPAPRVARRARRRRRPSRPSSIGSRDASGLEIATDDRPRLRGRARADAAATTRSRSPSTGSSRRR